MTEKIPHYGFKRIKNTLKNNFCEWMKKNLAIFCIPGPLCLSCTTSYYQATHVCCRHVGPILAKLCIQGLGTSKCRERRKSIDFKNARTTQHKKLAESNFRILVNKGLPGSIWCHSPVNFQNWLWNWGQFGSDINHKETFFSNLPLVSGLFLNPNQGFSGQFWLVLVLNLNWSGFLTH